MTEPTQHAPLQVMMISVHGLIRGGNLELGRDADTGGQITYALDLARALAEDEHVERVDLVTRLIEDPEVSADYAEAEETLHPKAAILRLPFGPRRYLRKESLWPHLDQMVDRCLGLLRQRGRLPDVIHTHYADAGYVGRQLSLLLGIPQFHTGHSLGRPKRARLLAAGKKGDSIDRHYHFNVRIEAEEDILAHASCIVTSTRQEIDEQYGLYRNREMQRFVVIPPAPTPRGFPRQAAAGFRTGWSRGSTASSPTRPSRWSSPLPAPTCARISADWSPRSAPTRRCVKWRIW